MSIRNTRAAHGWAAIALHVAGALKHLLLDRDDTLRRMLWARSAP